jgi:RNA polymerase sigma-70 factor (ECF subfamily)
MTALLPVAPSVARRTMAPKAYLLDPDVQLMLRVQRDEPGAFRELADRFWFLVFGRFFRRVGDRQLAEDLAQEAFLRLYRNRLRYQPQAKFATWLFHIVENLARNALRDRRRQPTRVESLDERHMTQALPLRGTPPDMAPDRDLVSADLVGIVRNGIHCLNGRQRDALILHEYQDRTYAQIADEFDITPEAAKSLLYRARNQLRSHLRPLLEAIA